MILSAKLTVDSISSVDIHTSIFRKVVRGVPSRSAVLSLRPGLGRGE